MEFRPEAIPEPRSTSNVLDWPNGVYFRRPKWGWLVSATTMATDVTAFTTSFLVSLLLTITLRQFLTDVEHGYIDPDWTKVHASIFAMIVVALIVWMAYRGHYRRRIPFWMEIGHIFAACIVGLLLDGFALYSLKEPFSRLWVFSTWILAIPTLIIFRVTLRNFLDRLGFWSIPTAVFGTPDTTERVRQVFSRETYLGYDVQAEIAPAPLCRARTGTQPSAEPVRAEFAVLCFGEGDAPAYEALAAHLARTGIPFAAVPPIRGLITSGLELHHFFNDDIIMMVESGHLLLPFAKILKRIFDLAISLALLTALMPLFLSVSLLIKRDGGPILFGGRRVGQEGRLFKCWKFRTMVVDGDERLASLLASDPIARAEWERDLKLRDDPRITALGRFLRRSSIDELPQLFNVVAGDMSLVGPRPLLPDQTERYGADFESYIRLRPGITGLWQVSGRNELSFERRVELDRWYIRNWSIWHDVAILFKTVPALLLRRGAY